MVKEPQNRRPVRVYALIGENGTSGARDHLVCNRKRKVRNFFRMAAEFSHAQRNEVGSLRLRSLQNRIAPRLFTAEKSSRLSSKFWEKIENGGGVSA